MKKLEKTLKRVLVHAGKESAKQSAGVFCRLWLGQEKVPRALLEREVR